MRAYGYMDELPDDEEEYSRVVPIRSNTWGRSEAVLGRARRDPWTPRETALPAAPARQPMAPPPSLGPRLTRTHRFMIAGFAIVAIGMVLGMAMVRVWDEASRAAAGIPTEGAAGRPNGPVATPARGTPEPTPLPTPAGTPVITTEIRVLQPNYTVAPGDTLGSIARRYGISVDALASINNLENRNSLSVGQKLVIP
jgi:hypothetical protein